MKKQTPKDLYEEALDVLEQSETLKNTAVWQSEQVEKICGKYSDEELDAMAWDEKEAHLKEVEELYGRLQQSVKELAELDERYRLLRERVNKKYGKEIMPPVDGRIPGLIGPEDEIELQ